LFQFRTTSFICHLLDAAQVEVPKLFTGSQSLQAGVRHLSLTQAEGLKVFEKNPPG
jgi:hypothetical protein